MPIARPHALHAVPSKCKGWASRGGVLPLVLPKSQNATSMRLYDLNWSAWVEGGGWGHGGLTVHGLVWGLLWRSWREGEEINRPALRHRTEFRQGRRRSIASSIQVSNGGDKAAASPASQPHQNHHEPHRPSSTGRSSMHSGVVPVFCGPALSLSVAKPDPANEENGDAIVVSSFDGEESI